MKPYITIYEGKTPPNIEGIFFIDPFEIVFWEYFPHGAENGNYAPGSVIGSYYIEFSNQNMAM